MSSRSLNIVDPKAVLDTISPLSAAFVSFPRVEILREVLKIIERLSDDVLQEIQVPLLFPFIIVLEKKKKISCFNEELHNAVLHLIDSVFKRTKIKNLDLFLEIVTLISHQLFDREKQSLIPNIDENIIKLSLSILTSAALHVDRELRLKIYIRNNAPQIAHCLFVCDQIGIHEKRLHIRLAAIDSLLAFCTLHDDQMKQLHSSKFDEEMLNCVGDFLMFVLPGILAGLKTIANGNITQSHLVTAASVKAISRILTFCMHDVDSVSKDVTREDFLKLFKNNNDNTAEKKPLFESKTKKKDLSQMKEHLSNAKKDENWYKTAAEKLVPLIKSILPLHSHDHENVRLEIAKLCLNIFTFCPRNMQPSLKYILETAIALSEDSVEKVATVAKTALDCYTKYSNDWNGKQLFEIIVENFDSLLNRVPRLLNSLDIDNQLSSGLNLLKGYIRLLTAEEDEEQKLIQIISNPIMMNRFAVALMEIVKIDNSSVNLLEDCAIRDLEVDIYFDKPWKKFIYLDSKTNIQSAMEILHLIGKSQAAELVVNFFSEYLDGGRHDNLKEAILILNEIVSISKIHLIEDVMSNYFEPNNWYLPIKVSRSEKLPGKDETLDVRLYNPRAWSEDYTPGLFEGAVETRYTDISYNNIIENNVIIEECDEDSCRTILEAKNNVICVCLMTEGIGKMAKTLGNKFEMHLLRSLYLILERAGSTNEIIHLAGLQTLKEIAEACGLRDITELIKENSDYFSHHVNIKLRKIGENSGVLDVLLIVMKYSEVSVLPCLYEILDNVMIQCFNPLEKNNYESFLKLFLTFIKYVGSKFPSEISKIEERESSECTIDEIKKQLAEFIHHRNVLKNDFACEEEMGKSAEEMWNEDMEKNKLADENDDIANEEHAEKPIPSHIKMISTILKKTLNFVPSSERSLRLLSLEIIKEGLLIIRNYENELLPLVHLVWGPLVHRFKDTNHPLIINRSFKLLAVLAEVSKDFIKARTIKDVMPSMCTFLKTSAKESKAKNLTSAYQFSQMYKLQLCLLEELGDLCISLKFQEKQINNIMCAVDPYLSSKQPKALQDACIKMFKKILVYDAANCWLHLSGLSSKIPALSKVPHGERFKNYESRLLEPNLQNEYEQNVKQIFSQ